MVISITGILLYAEVSPLYNALWECTVVINPQRVCAGVTVVSGLCVFVCVYVSVCLSVC